MLVCLSPTRRFFLAAFLLCQCWFNAFVTFASQFRSWVCSSSSDAAKNFTLYGEGLPNGFSNRAATRIGTSFGWQLITHAACSAVSRAGN